MKISIYVCKTYKKTDSTKAWNRVKQSNNPYAIESTKKARTFLIVCEGSNTEVAYFRSIPAPNADIVFKGGCGSKTALVKEAVDLFLKLAQDENAKNKLKKAIKLFSQMNSPKGVEFYEEWLKKIST